MFAAAFIRYEGEYMRIEYFGHSCFRFTEDRKSFLTDPFTRIGYELPRVSADFVTVSHGHFDHNYLAGVSGMPKVIDRAGEFAAGGVKITGIDCAHDDKAGALRGGNIAFTYDFGGFTVCHLGDLGETFSEERASRFGHPDVLLIPVGGTYTIDAREAVRYIQAIGPKVVIPMHYRTERCTLDIAPLSDFIGAFGKERVCGPEAFFDSGHIENYMKKALVLEVCGSE